MSETKVDLTDDQLKSALTLYAHGKTSNEVIDELLFDYPDLEDSPENRAMLREQLRSVNPNDKRFAKSKYGEFYSLVSTAAVETLRQESKTAMQEVVNSIIKGIEEFDTIGASLLTVIENASDFDVTSNSEYLNTIRAFATLQKTKIEGVNAMSSLVEQLIRLSMLSSASESSEEE